VVSDEASYARARKGAEQAGVLVEIQSAAPTRLPFDDGNFDVAVVDDTGGLFGSMGEQDRAGSVRELLRILRPGGRLMIIGRAPRSGIAALLARAPSEPSFTAAGGATRALQAGGFASTRLLAEREGLVFVEGIKPRN